MSFSGAVKLSSASLNDFIEPSQACAIALETERLDKKGIKLNAKETDENELDLKDDFGFVELRQRTTKENVARSSKDDRDNGFLSEVSVVVSVKKEKGNKAVKVSLSDCLACSGCVTSAETVLMEQQSVEEFTRVIEKREKIVMVTISPQSCASVAVKFNRSSEECLRKLSGFFKARFGARKVFSSNEARAASLGRYANEFMKRVGRGRLGGLDSKDGENSMLPMIVSACPGWVCYAEKTENALRDVNLLAETKSPQAVAGTFAKKNKKKEEEVFHVSVMPCFDKKLEASRKEFRTENGENETDCVLTTTELVELLEKENVLDEDAFRCLPSEKIDSMFLFNDDDEERDYSSTKKKTMDDNDDEEDMMDVEKKDDDDDEDEDDEVPPGFAATSGGYLEYVFRKAAKELYGINLKGQNLEYKTLTNVDMREVELKVRGEVKLKFLLAYGFRNVQNVTRALKREPNKWDFVEMMACPSGCANGGGQIPPERSYLNAKLLKRVEDVYIQGEEAQKKTLSLTKKAIKSKSILYENDLDLQTTYNAVAASSNIKNKVTIANVDNW